MINGIQIIGILFGLLMLYLTFIYRKRNDFDQKEVVVWAVVWIAFISAALFPKILNPVTENLNFARTMDLLIIAGFMFVICISFCNYHNVKKTQRKIEDIVRKTAIKEANK